MNFIDQKGFDDLQSSLDGRAKSEYTPAFTAGSAGALFDGAANGFSQISTQAAAAGYDSGDADIGSLLGLNNSDDPAAYPSPETIRQSGKWASDNLRPDPQTTGTMAQILFGVGDVGARFAVGLPAGAVGGALTSGTSVGKERYDELISQGVDSNTALKAAGIRGAFTGVGALLPAGVGGGIATRIASGAAINTAAGAAGRGAEGAVLAQYPKQADELHAFRAQDIAVDALLGSVFGGISRLGVDVTHEQLDAALSLKNAKSFNMDAMPGDPVTVGDVARHSKVMDTAIDDILNDRPVSVDAQSGGVKFTPRQPVEPQATHLLTEDTPPAPDGFVRLYRGEHKNHDREVFNTDDQNDGKVGGWFTQDKDYADYYRTTQEQGRPSKDKAGRVVFVDIPKEDLTHYQVAGSKLGEDGIRTNEDSYFIGSLRRADVIDPEPYVSPKQSYADIVKAAFDEEGYGKVHEEMTQAEARAAQIDRSQSQFAPEDVPDVAEPAAFKDLQSETFRDLEAGDRVTPSRDVAGLRSGEEAHVQSVDEQGAVHFAGKDGETISVPREAANSALDVGLNIRRPVPTDKAVPTEFGKTEPASEVIASADKGVEDATTEGKAYNAAIDCFLSRGN